jgi:hypothetical protein
VEGEVDVDVASSVLGKPMLRDFVNAEVGIEVGVDVEGS